MVCKSIQHRRLTTKSIDALVHFHSQQAVRPCWPKRRVLRLLVNRMLSILIERLLRGPEKRRRCQLWPTPSLAKALLIQTIQPYAPNGGDVMYTMRVNYPRLRPDDDDRNAGDVYYPPDSKPQRWVPNGVARNWRL